MREYEHLIGKHKEILLADPRSAKATWGHNQPEYLEQDDPHFLREGYTLFPDHNTVYQLTEPSDPIGDFHGNPYGNGRVVVEARDCSGGYHEAGIHESMIVWKSKPHNDRC